MKKIGIIGGAGPLASALLYETLIQESYKLGHQIPEIILINYPFTRGLSLYENKENKEIIQQELNYCIQVLEKNAVEASILACNTLHLFLQLHPQLPIPFYHLPELVMQAAKEKRHSQLLILGTQNTRHFQLYQCKGIEAFYPSFKDQEKIHSIIDHILAGKILKEDALLVSQIIENAAHFHHFDAVVLGCTDLPVLHHSYPIASAKPIYDSIKIPAKTVVGLL